MTYEGIVGGAAWKRLPSVSAAGLPRDSVVNVTALVTLDKDDLGPPAGAVPGYLVEEVDRGLRRALDL